MRPIGPTKSDDLRNTLSEWHSINAMKSALSEIKRQHGYYAAGQRALQFWREAHCACQFAEILGAGAIRLGNPDPPDFELRLEDRISQCELVEVRNPSIRMGDKYKSLADDYNTGRNPEYQDLDIDSQPQWLEASLAQAIIKKSAKGYDKNLTLAVFVHAWTFFDDQRSDFDKAAFNAAMPHLDKFKEIWILNAGRMLIFSAKQATDTED